MSDTNTYSPVTRFLEENPEIKRVDQAEFSAVVSLLEYDTYLVLA